MPYMGYPYQGGYQPGYYGSPYYMGMVPPQAAGSRSPSTPSYYSAYWP